MSASSLSAPRSSYGRGARILSVGIATTGVVTFAYFALAAHALTPAQYTRISLLWSIMFVIVSVIYRPIEQLLSRTIAERRARGQSSGGAHLRIALLIQATFAALFLAAALAFRDELQDDIFDGSSSLYWVLVVGVLAYAASYFARGFLAGHQRFALYGALVFLEATSRVCFALAVIVGLASGQTAVAMGMAAAPLVSLVVVPAFFARREDPPADPAAVASSEGGLTLRRGAGFAVAVFGVMVAEQTLLNAAVLTVSGTSDDPALAGIVFSVLLIARAPLQLFQAVQGSLLPHLAGLQATAGGSEFRRAIRVTVLASGGFGLAVALGLFAIGPEVVGPMFDIDRDLARGGLALVGLGMGLHLIAGTLNQAALARERAVAASVSWLVSALAFVVFMLSSVVDDQLLRAEAGYCGGAALLCLLLAVVYRRG
ncbi:MAG TPA: oligosaccharide flippase family protein [Solirubrobacteraceae bacterium]|nr:oligosaccharide flippase family protein [Solirubrobacteraceae bacterium]